MEGEKLNCFQFHRVTTWTETHFECYWVMCMPTQEPRAVPRRSWRVNHEVPTAQGTDVCTAQSLGNSLPLHCKGVRGLISQEQGRCSNQARLCAAMTCTPGASWQPVWRSGVFSPGGIRAALRQGQGLYCCTQQVCLPWWFSVISPHYGTLDQKADEMEVLGRWLQTKCAWGRTTGWDEEMVAQLLHLSSLLRRNWAQATRLRKRKGSTVDPQCSAMAMKKTQNMWGQCTAGAAFAAYLLQWRTIPKHQCFFKRK